MQILNAIPLIYVQSNHGERCFGIGLGLLCAAEEDQVVSAVAWSWVGGWGGGCVSWAYRQ